MGQKRKATTILVVVLFIFAAVAAVLLVVKSKEVPSLGSYMQPGDDLQGKVMYVEKGDTVDDIIARTYSQLDDVRAVPIESVRKAVAEANDLDGDYTIHWGNYILVPYIRKG